MISGQKLLPLFSTDYGRSLRWLNPSLMRSLVETLTCDDSCVRWGEIEEAMRCSEMLKETLHTLLCFLSFAAL